MAHINAIPPGVFKLSPIDRKNIVLRVNSGDTWPVSVNLYDPLNPENPATPENTYVRIILSETQFDHPLWSGEWYKGVTPDAVRKGLCHIKIPRDITKILRRGSYQFSIRVADILKTIYLTEAEGSFLVEYKPTSETHDIPYKQDEEPGEIVPEVTSEELEKIVQQMLAEKLRKMALMLDDENASIYDVVTALKTLSITVSDETTSVYDIIKALSGTADL